MSSPAIALPNRSSLLWFRHARTLLTGYGYAQAQSAPAAVLRQLTEVRNRYGAARPAADNKLEELIHDLRASVARGLAANAPPESAA
jgi:selenocysteine lyase/cysteine desulfurase